jgi:hypothetical protein
MNLLNSLLVALFCLLAKAGSVKSGGLVKRHGHWHGHHNHDLNVRPVVQLGGVVIG